MSSPPPTSNRSVANNPAGDGVEVSVDSARGGQRTGRVVWIMAISIGVLVALFAIYLIANAHHTQTINHPSGRDLNTSDAASFHTPAPQPRQVPTTSSGGNTGQ